MKMLGITKGWNLFVSVVLTFAVSLVAWGQQDDKQRFEVKGFVDTYQALRSRSPFDFMSSRSTVRTEVKKTFGSSQVNVSLNIVHNALLKEETSIRLREAYFEHRERHWGLKAGRQLIIWGVADGIRITDHLSPMDLTEFLAQDYDDIRMPVNALRFLLFNEKVQFEAVLVPTFEGYKLPTDSRNPWCPFAALDARPGLKVSWDTDAGRPDFNIRNIEYGGRLSFTLPGVDFSLSALHTWNKMPIFEQQWVSPQALTIVPRHYRMGLMGADIALPVRQVVIRGEAALSIDKHFTYSAPKPSEGFETLNWLMGIDWYAPDDWMISGQVSSESIFGYKSHISQDQTTALLTLSISKSLMGNTLKLSDFAYIDMVGQGWFSRFTADYALSDQIHIMGGYDWLGSRKGGLFDAYKKNSEFWLRVRYSF